MHVIIHLCKPKECTEMNHNANYGPWLIMTCQCRFIQCNKCLALLEDADNGGGGEGLCMCGGGGIWTISVPPPSVFV